MLKFKAEHGNSENPCALQECWSVGRMQGHLKEGLGCSQIVSQGEEDGLRDRNILVPI